MAPGPRAFVGRGEARAGLVAVLLERPGDDLHAAVDHLMNRDADVAAVVVAGAAFVAVHRLLRHVGLREVFLAAATGFGGECAKGASGQSQDQGGGLGDGLEHRRILFPLLAAQGRFASMRTGIGEVGPPRCHGGNRGECGGRCSGTDFCACTDSASRHVGSQAPIGDFGRQLEGRE